MLEGLLLQNQYTAGIVLRRRIEHQQPDGVLSPEMVATVGKINNAYVNFFGQHIPKQRISRDGFPFQIHVVNDLPAFSEKVFQADVNERNLAIALPFAKVMLLQNPATVKIPSALDIPLFQDDAFPISYAHELSHLLQSRRLFLSPHPGAAVFYECGARYYTAKSTEELTWGSPLILAEEARSNFYEALMRKYGEEVVHGIFFGTYNVSRKERREKEQEVLNFCAHYGESLFPGGYGLSI